MFAISAGSRMRKDARASAMFMVAAAFVACALPSRSFAQVAVVRDTPGTDLDAIVRRAMTANPAVRAARARLSAAQARIAPAAAWPDPVLTAGLINQPLGSMSAGPAVAPGVSASRSLPDEMTMKVIGVSQSIIYPGKLALARRVAELEAEAARAAIDVTRRDIARRANDAYYELAYLDRAIDITAHTSGVLADVVRLTESHYSTGAGAQEDVLKARAGSARLSETANMLMEQRRVALAQLNAVLDQPSDRPVSHESIPARIRRAALARDAAHVRFAAQTLGSPAADSPLPPVIALQNLAVEHSPDLREHEAMIAAQAARVDLARKAYKPDFDLSLQYGERTGRPDMITAQVSVPLHLHRRMREDQQLAEASAGLAALHAEHESKVNALQEDVARLAAEVDRNRTQLALYTKAVLPQERAAVTAALVSYQAGRSGLAAVLDDENTVFFYETAYSRALTDFAKNIAKLEQVVGVTVLP